MSIQAYYGTRRGGSGVRAIKSVAEAEKILKGGYGVTNVTLQNEKGEVVGLRQRADWLDRGKWFWYYDPSYFA